MNTYKSIVHTTNLSKDLHTNFLNLLLRKGKKMQAISIMRNIIRSSSYNFKLIDETLNKISSEFIVKFNKFFGETIIPLTKEKRIRMGIKRLIVESKKNKSKSMHLRILNELKLVSKEQGKLYTKRLSEIQQFFKIRSKS